MTLLRIITPLLLTGWLMVHAIADTSEVVVVNEENPESLPVLTQVDKPFVFIYGSWENHVKVENGVARIQCPNGKGAAGQNENMTASADQHVILRVKTGPENKAKILRLVLRDAAANTAVWEYDLSTVSPNVPTFIRPIGNVSLSKPHSIDKKDGEPGESPDPAKLTQWKLTGDWTDDPIDVEVSVMLLDDN